MMDKKIFKGNRGEGKTKWLVDKAIDILIKIDQGLIDTEDLEVFYVGDFATHANFCNFYEKIMHTKCPIKRWLHNDMNGCHRAILFTDELLYNLPRIPSNIPVEGEWYITMSAEDFVQ